MSSFYDQNRFSFFGGNLSNFGSNAFGNRSFDKYRSIWNGPLLASTDTPVVGAPGNIAGVANAKAKNENPLMTGAAMLQAIYKDPGFMAQPEAVRIAAMNQLGALAQNLDLRGVIEQSGINQNENTKLLIEAQAQRAREANEMGKENLKLANEMNRSNTVLSTLLQLPGQISDSWTRAATAGLPYQQEARQMMANAGANLQTGYSNLANMNTQFGNQISNLFSNAAAYRPTLIAGKYF